jgi:hypothetical protein
MTFFMEIPPLKARTVTVSDDETETAKRRKMVYDPANRRYNRQTDGAIMEAE